MICKVVALGFLVSLFCNVEPVWSAAIKQLKNSETISSNTQFTKRENTESNKKEIKSDIDEDSDRDLPYELHKLTSLSGVKKSAINFAQETPDEIHTNKHEGKLEPGNNPIESFEKLVDDDFSKDKGTDQFLIIPVNYLKKQLKINSLNDFFERSLVDAKLNEYSPVEGDSWTDREIYDVPQIDMENELKNAPVLTQQELVKTHHDKDNAALFTTAAPAGINPSTNDLINKITPGKMDELHENEYNFNIDFSKLQEDLKVLKEDLQNANIM